MADRPPLENRAHYPALVIGTGIAGLSIAFTLASAGIKVLLVTKAADPADCNVQFDPIGKTVFNHSCDLAKSYLAKAGITGVKTVDQVLNNPEVNKVIQAGIDRANKKAVSNAAKVKGWFIAKDDFTIVNGEFTPTLKVKRNVVTKKYAEKIAEIYSKQDL